MRFEQCYKSPKRCRALRAIAASSMNGLSFMGVSGGEGVRQRADIGGEMSNDLLHGVARDSIVCAVSNVRADRAASSVHAAMSSVGCSGKPRCRTICLRGKEGATAFPAAHEASEAKHRRAGTGAGTSTLWGGVAMVARTS